MVDKHSYKNRMNKVKLAVMLALSTGLSAAIGGSTLPVFAGGNGDHHDGHAINVNTMMTTIAIVMK